MIILYLLLLLIAVILVRTLLFTPKKQPRTEADEISFDREASINALAELVKCRTVSYEDSSLEDDAEFEKLIGKLPELYPHVMESCSLTRLPGRALLFRWYGRTEGDAAVLMAHYDVVPVEEENWSRPPFSTSGLRKDRPSMISEIWLIVE